METTVADLPDLIIGKILVRLSPADLLRAALVCPRWCGAADDLILRKVMVRLAPTDLLRAALACRRWCGAALRAAPSVTPLRGYLFHPFGPSDHHASVFRPLNDGSSSARALTIDFTPRDPRKHCIHDVHLGLVLLLPHPCPRSGSLFPRILVVDPASRREVQLPPVPPPHNALPGCFIGAAVLARGHPSRLTFDAVVFMVCDDRPCAWVASFVDGNLADWRALPRTEGVVLDFDSAEFDSRCVHAAGIIYWHIFSSSRVLQLNPRTLIFSFMTVPHAVGDGLFGVHEYRVGETPEGQLCIASIVEDQFQIWVPGGQTRWSDRQGGWDLQRNLLFTSLVDAVPGVRQCIKLRDVDFAGTGKIFFGTPVGSYSYNLKTGVMERSVLNGHPLFAYTLPWPPEFLSP